MVFIDLEKAYDKVPKDLIWWVLSKRSVPGGYIEIIKDMYEGATISVRVTCGGTCEFSLAIGLHQGSALSPQLHFTLIMDELTAHVQEEVPWYMLFTDDIMLVDELRGSMNGKLKRWREVLDCKTSHTKIAYIDINFSGHVQRAESLKLL